MRETHLRSFLKAISWRILATFLTISISYVITHKINLAVYIGVFEFITKVGFFYLHERIWGGISFGSQKLTNIVNDVR